VKSGKEKITSEVKCIPLTSIFDMNEGEKEKIAETGLEVFEKKCGGLQHLPMDEVLKHPF
jgi:hypothetical protein